MSTNNLPHWNNQAVLDAFRLQLLLKRKTSRFRACMSNPSFVVGLSRVLKLAANVPHRSEATDTVYEWLTSEQTSDFLHRRDIHEFWGILHNILLHPEKSGVTQQQALQRKSSVQTAAPRSASSRPHTPPRRREFQQETFVHPQTPATRPRPRSVPIGRMPLTPGTAKTAPPASRPPRRPTSSSSSTPYPRTSGGYRSVPTPSRSKSYHATRHPSHARPSLRTLQRESSGHKTTVLEEEIASFRLPAHAVWWKDSSVVRAVRLRVVREPELGGFYDLLNDPSFMQQFCFVLREAADMPNCSDAIHHVHHWLVFMANRTQAYSTMRLWGYMAPQLLNNVRAVRMHHFREQANSSQASGMMSSHPSMISQSSLQLLNPSANPDSDESSDRFLAALDEMVHSIAASFMDQ